MICLVQDSSLMFSIYGMFVIGFLGLEHFFMRFFILNQWEIHFGFRTDPSLNANVIRVDIDMIPI